MENFMLRLIKDNYKNLLTNNVKLRRRVIKNIIF